VRVLGSLTSTMSLWSVPTMLGKREVKKEERVQRWKISTARWTPIIGIESPGQTTQSLGIRYLGVGRVLIKLQATTFLQKSVAVT